MAIITILKALADDTRLGIVRLLLDGSKNVTEIVSKVKKSQPNISLALKQLLYAGIIAQRKDGRMIFYSVKEPAKIKQLLRLLEDEKR